MVNTSVTITANVTDADGIATVRLYYRQYGSTSWHFSKDMSHIGSGNYQTFIPADMVTSVGVEYYIQATDINNNTSTSGSPSEPYRITVTVPDTTGPTISHTSTNNVVAGTTVTISCIVSDPSGIKNVVLYYKNSLQQNFGQYYMQYFGSSYTYTISGKEVVPDEIKYYISATDNYNNVSYYGSASSPIIITVITTSTSPPTSPPPTTNDDATGPTVFHIPITSATNNTPIEINIEAYDISGIKTITLYYRNIGDVSYKTKTFSIVNSNNYSATIPATDITAKEIRYFIIAIDNKDNATFVPEDYSVNPYKVSIITLENSTNTSNIVIIDRKLLTSKTPAKVKFSINPFSTKTNVKFVVYNLSGKKVKEISDWNKIYINPQTNLAEVSWDGKDENDTFVMAGIYIYKLELDNTILQSGKLVVVK